MGEELNALWDNETSKLTPLPESRTSGRIRGLCSKVGSQWGGKV